MQKIGFFQRDCPRTKRRRFWGSFEPIFDFFLRGLYQTSYTTPAKKNQKSAKIIPQNRRRLVRGQFQSEM
jgi:hypothetical protein